MIELVRDLLDPRDRERWRVALTQPAAVSRPAWRIDRELALFVALLSFATGLLTLTPIALELGASAVTGLRVVALFSLVLAVRAVDRMTRASRCVWPRGRFLFTWGYAEVEDDVLRVVPIEVLVIAVRARSLGVGPIRLVLRSNAWRTTLLLRPQELVAVANVIEQSDESRSSSRAEGYRDAPTRIEGPPARWQLGPGPRELAWVVSAALIGGVVPIALLAADAPAVHGPYEAALTSANARPSLVVDLDGCSGAPPQLQRVAMFLTAALGRRDAGPLPVFAPPMRVHERTSASIWARCSWEVDPTTGMLASVVARWGLDRGAQRRIERLATIPISAVVELIDRCGPADARLDVSPEGLALASVALARTAILRDLVDGKAVESANDDAPLERCVRERGERLAVLHVLDS